MSIEQRGTIEQSITLSKDSKKAKRNIIYFCSNGESLSDVMNTSDFPVIGAQFPGISGLYCSEIILKPERDGKKSRVSAECIYTAAERNINLPEGVEYGKAFDFKVSPIETKVPFLYSYDKVDSNGRPAKPVCSSAGEFFNLETTEITMLIRFSYYIRSFTPEWILDLTNTTNRKAIRVCGIGIGEECGLLRTLSAESVEINGDTEIQVNVELEINPAGFLRKVPNRGYFCFDGTRYSRVCYGVSKYNGYTLYAPFVQLLDDRKEDTPIMPVDDPVWLDSAGRVHQTQSAEQNTMLLSFKEKRSADWSVLALPEQNPW